MINGFRLLIQWLDFIQFIRYCLQSLAIKYTRKDTAFRTELSQGLSAISCVYYKTYTSFKGAKIQIYFYNKKLFSSFLSQGRFGMGAIENMGDLQWGQFVTWVICITYSAAPARGLCPYDARKRTHTMPMMPFLCIYTYVCERPDNTRVGANCN